LAEQVLNCVCVEVSMLPVSGM